MKRTEVQCLSARITRALVAAISFCVPFAARAEIVNESVEIALLPQTNLEYSVDAALSVFISDIHLSGENMTTGWGLQPTYQNAIFNQAVGKILAMNPRPKRLVMLGDISVWFGYRQDYEAAQPGLKRLADAGIEIHITAGNHDHRDPMRKAFPQALEKTCVSGRFVTVVDLGNADLLLLDTLNENRQGEGSYNPAGGIIDDAQWKWFEAEAKARTRPFLVGSHHPPTDIGGRDVRKLLTPNKNFIGWIHGHDHVWSKRWFLENWQLKRFCRIAGLPSGFNCDIGFAVMRTFGDHAELRLEQSDFMFPAPLKPGEKRPPIWDRIVDENRGEYCAFDYRG